MHRLSFVLVLGCAFIRAAPLVSYEKAPTNGMEEIHPPSKDIIDLSHYGSALFGKPDQGLTGALVHKFSDTDNVNPEELGSYLEGDMLVPQTAITMKNGLATQSSRWPKGVVPYAIEGDFDILEVAIILNAFEEYHKRTCIRFVPHSGQRDYISITNGWSGCWSAVGRVGGVQYINFQTPGCLRRHGTVLHELMHALGFLHEHSRKERDDYVAIHYTNIRSGAVRNFQKVNNTEGFGVPYDYDSVMHYSGKAFSSNGQPTILAKQSDGNSRMGQRIGFSDLDVEKLNRMYDCDQDTTVAPTEASASSSVAESSNANPTTSEANSKLDTFLSLLVGIMKS